MNDFKVNEYLTLKIEKGSTVIYLKGEKFNQCKYLTFNINFDNVQELDDIKSIDELEEKDRSNDYKTLDISPEQEFWGHCSNIQVWAENDYDTRLLHSNLAFPLLKKLTELGDPMAKRVFKNEIAERFSIRNISVIRFLLIQGYLKYLNKEEINTLFEEFDFEIITKQKPHDVFSILRQLTNVDVRHLIIENIFKSRNLQIINSLIKESYETFLDEKRFKTLFKGLNSLIHRIRITFPLLAKLTEGEDMIVINEYKKQIIAMLPESNEEEIESLFNMNTIFGLNFSKYKLKIIPEELTKLTKLKIIVLQRAQLKTLPESFGNLTSLQTLILSSNQLITLPKSFGNLTSLQTLNLSNNQLATLPESIKFKQLTDLRLGYNRLTTLPESIGNLSSLEKLYLRDNQLTTIPASIGGLSSLQVLFLNDNRLTTLPESIEKLKSITELRLENNQLTTLPESIGSLKSLEKLYLKDNQLTTLPEAIGDLKALQVLFLSGNQLTTLPESIGNLSSLEKLYLYGNKLSTLPESIKKLTSLRELYLSKNSLWGGLPEPITKLKSLQTLDLRNNQLTILPESIGRLTSLFGLDLGLNNLSTLPESIGDLKSLQILDLSYNQLSSLPDSISNLHSLNKLYLKGNLLKLLPKSLNKKFLQKQIEPFFYYCKKCNRSHNRGDIFKDHLKYASIDFS